LDGLDSSYQVEFLRVRAIVLEWLGSRQINGSSNVCSQQEKVDTTVASWRGDGIVVLTKSKERA
jgi:hypothetical protein